MNQMKNIKVEKITLNIGTGKPGPELEKAMKLLSRLTNAKPVQTTTSKRIPTWSLRPGLPIGTKVTLRGKKAEEMLPKLLEAVENRLSRKRFDNQGNFSFGIAEYLDIAGMKYDLELGIMGLEVAVTLMRPGFRIKKRATRNRKIPERHRISKDEAIKFVAEKYGVTFEGE